MRTFGWMEINGYRRLLSARIELRPLNVLIGANGVGKTSILEVFSLLSATAEGPLEARIAQAGGLTEILTRDRASSLRLGVQMELPDEMPLVYSLEIAPKGQAYEIAAETLTQHRDPDLPEPFKHIEARGPDIRYSSPGQQGFLRPNWIHDPYETSLSQVPKMYREPERFRAELAGLAVYGPVNVAPRSPIRLPQTMRRVELPSPSGDDLVACLYYLRETDPDRFEAILDTLASAFPGFERLSFPPVAAGTLAMTWKEVNFTTPFFMHQLSEGTLRFLWLVTILASSHLPSITLIDEPEMSLHPELLRLLVDLLREATSRTQLVVATQSDRLVHFLNPEEVLVLDAVDGLTQLTWSDTMDLDRWLAEYRLDELWAMNLIGGRPS